MNGQLHVSTVLFAGKNTLYSMGKRTLCPEAGLDALWITEKYSLSSGIEPRLSDRPVHSVVMISLKYLVQCPRHRKYSVGHILIGVV